MFMSVLPDVCATEVKSCSSCFDLAAAARGKHFSCRVVVFRVHRPWLLSTTGSALSRWSEKLNTNIRLTNNERQQYQSDWSVLSPASILCFWDHQKNISSYTTSGQILHTPCKHEKMIWEVSKNIFAEGRMNPSMSGNWWPLDGSRLAQLLLQSLPHSCDSPGRGLRRGWVISLRIQPLSHRAKTPFIHCQQAHSHCHLCVCVMFSDLIFSSDSCVCSNNNLAYHVALSHLNACIITQISHCQPLSVSFGLFMN